MAAISTEEILPTKRITSTEMARRIRRKTGRRITRDTLRSLMFRQRERPQGVDARIETVTIRTTIDQRTDAVTFDQDDEAALLKWYARR